MKKKIFLSDVCGFFPNALRERKKNFRRFGLDRNEQCTQLYRSNITLFTVHLGLNANLVLLNISSVANTQSSAHCRILIPFSVADANYIIQHVWRNIEFTVFYSVYMLLPSSSHHGISVTALLLSHLFAWQ